MSPGSRGSQENLKMARVSRLALTRWPNTTAFVGRLRLTPRHQPRTELQARRGRESVAIRPKIAIVFSIFLYYDDDGDKKPISREGVIYERLSAKIVLSRARRSRTAQDAFIACQGEIWAGWLYTLSRSPSPFSYALITILYRWNGDICDAGTSVFDEEDRLKYIIATPQLRKKSCWFLMQKNILLILLSHESFLSRMDFRGE